MIFGIVVALCLSSVLSIVGEDVDCGNDDDDVDDNDDFRLRLNSFLTFLRKRSLAQ